MICSARETISVLSIGGGDVVVRRSFAKEGVPKLLDAAGKGTLRGRVTVSQVYAQYQHERTDLFHPRGGVAGYLRKSLFDRHPDYLRFLAQHVFDGEIDYAMEHSMRGLNMLMSSRTPILFNNLRRSGAVSVFSNGLRVRYRPPAQRRLTSQELKDLRRQIVGTGPVRRMSRRRV